MQPTRAHRCSSETVCSVNPPAPMSSSPESVIQRPHGVNLKGWYSRAVTDELQLEGHDLSMVSSTVHSSTANSSTVHSSPELGKHFYQNNGGDTASLAVDETCESNHAEDFESIHRETPRAGRGLQRRQLPGQHPPTTSRASNFGPLTTAHFRVSSQTQRPPATSPLTSQYSPPSLSDFSQDARQDIVQSSPRAYSSKRHTRMSLGKHVPRPSCQQPRSSLRQDGDPSFVEPYENSHRSDINPVLRQPPRESSRARRKFLTDMPSLMPENMKTGMRAESCLGKRQVQNETEGDIKLTKGIPSKKVATEATGSQDSKRLVDIHKVVGFFVTPNRVKHQKSPSILSRLAESEAAGTSTQKGLSKHQRGITQNAQYDPPRAYISNASSLTKDLSSSADTTRNAGTKPTYREHTRPRPSDSCMRNGEIRPRTQDIVSKFFSESGKLGSRADLVHQPTSPSLRGDPPIPETPNRDHHWGFDQSEARFRRYGQNSVDRRRSQSSPSSNISRKRSTIRKHRPRVATDRKTKAMHQVAQSWNECLKTFEEERSNASQKIDGLKQNLRQQRKSLIEARSQLTEKNKDMGELVHYSRNLEADRVRAANDKHQLLREIDSLRHQLATTQDQASALQDKAKRYKEKINHAIEEQQNLFRHSKVFYEKAMEELRNENKKHISCTAEVDKALEMSIRKREEMKQCVQDLHDQVKMETQQKDRTIVQLQCKVQDLADRQGYRNDITASMRRQLELQHCTQIAVKDMASKLDCLLQTCTERSHDSDKVMSQIHFRLDTVMEHLQTSCQQLAPGILTDRIMPNVEAGIVDKIEHLKHHQQCTHQVIVQLANECARELTEIKTDIVALGNLFVETQVEERIKVERFLADFECHAQSTRASHKQVMEFLESWSQAQSRRQKNLQVHQTDLNHSLLEHNERIKTVEQDLVLVKDGYADKLGTLVDNASNCTATMQEKFCDAIAEFRDTLEEGLRVAKEGSENGIRQNQSSTAALAGQIKAIADYLEASCRMAVGDTSVSSSSTAEQQAIIDQLQKKIRILEVQAQGTKTLRDRWQHDVNAVQSLRGQLKNIQQRVPEVQQCLSTLNNIAQVNGLLHSTAQNNVEQKRIGGQFTRRRPLRGPEAHKKSRQDRHSAGMTVEGMDAELVSGDPSVPAAFNMFPERDKQGQSSFLGAIRREDG
ncbi:hypothetical protein DCS_06878 [Drechmeria coniospora]|uniref:Uncharacterized protein n=1 Tax=Drechmeria coniospora TaxID=98403 RepID=A0A151GCS0_DRECN|nr:hypothetical protein DCS_06878 [Drechmeria coniospora]KYK54917.1 hypothetical protein DCS_06878 [Drechmeria coniospora]